MKFLVISKPAGNESDVSKHPENTRGISEQLKKAKEAGKIEHAWAFVGGGHAYIVNANDTVSLTKIVRNNPWFRHSTVDVIPVADAVSFLEKSAGHVEKHYMPKRKDA